MTQNLYKWADENLSEQRARAFKNALREIDNSKFSTEWREASAKCDRIADSHYVAHKDEITAIETKARTEAQVLREQIKKLQEQVWEIDAECQNAVMRIRCGAYATAEYKEQEAVASALWRRDEEAVQPLRDALVARYSAAQAKASA